MKILFVKALIAFLAYFIVQTSCSAIDKSIDETLKRSFGNSSIEQHISVKKWLVTDSAVRNLSSSLVKTILPYAVRAFEDLDLSSSCARGLLKFLSGLKKMKTWAFKMVDSSGKIPNGLFSGSINSLGEYDECVDTVVPGHFQGLYCTLDITPPLPERRRFVSTDSEVPEFINVTDPESVTGEFMKMAMYYYHLKFRTSVCMPSTCNRREVELIASNALETAGIHFNVNIPNCEIKTDKWSLSGSQTAILGLLLFLTLLGVSATILEIIQNIRVKENIKEKMNIQMKCLLCFSFYSNTVRLLKKDSSSDSIKIFHGMKVITILWVILNHTYYYLNFQACSSLFEARAKGKEFFFQFVINGFLNVETFFFISSVLVAYRVMKMKEKKLNILLYILRRFWRLTPPFMLVIACVQLLPLIGSGPVWKETIVQGLTEKCQNYWWANLLYINNFIPAADACLQWHWYIPVDTHLYILSLIVVIPLKKNRRLALLLNGVLFCVGIIMTAVSNVYYDLPPTAIYVYNHPDDINYFVDNGYFRTYLHVSTYCIGLTVGYIIATRPNIHLSQRTNLSGWIISFSLSITVLYGVYDWNQGNVPDLFVSTFYTCVNKLVWALALAWVTVACMTGNGGFVTDILSWQAFVPFGRLTYMAYLIHPLIQYVYIGSTRTLIRTDHRTILYMYLANVVLSFMCAFGLSLLFESPFMALEKLLFSEMKSKDKTTENERAINATIDNGKFCNQVELKNVISK